MSEEAIRDSLNRFKEIQEAPNLRSRIAELENIISEEKQGKERIKQKHAQEINILQNRIHRQSDIIKKSKSRIRELESIQVKVGKEKISLREFKKRAKKQVKEEMRHQCVIESNKLAKIKVPIFTQIEIEKYPNCMNEIKQLIDTTALSLRDEYLINKDMWSPEFRSQNKQYIDSEVEKEKNEAFWIAFHKEADFEIEQRLPGKWKNYLRTYATTFIQLTIQDQLHQLTIPLNLYCPKCRGEHKITLTSSELDILIRSGRISFGCSYCTGLFKPNVTLYLGELFWLVYNGDLKPKKPARATIGSKING